MSKSFGIFAIAFAAFLWAFEGTVLTPRLQGLAPGIVVLSLHALTFIILNPFMFKEYLNLGKFDRTDWIFLSLIAIFGGAIGSLAIVKALFLVNFQKISVVVLLQQLQPVFAILLAVILLKEKAHAKFYFWAGFAVISSYFLAFGFNLPNIGPGRTTLFAALFALLAAASWGASTVFSRKIATKHNYKTITFFRNGFTTVFMLIYVLLFVGFDGFSLVSVSNLGIIAIISLTSGVVSLMLYYYGLKNIRAIVATICELVFPLSAVFLDYFINGSTLSIIQSVAAIGLVVAITRISVLTARNNI